MSPFTAGRHVYDYGHLFTLQAAATADFQAALDAVYPIIGNSDQKAKVFKHAGPQWKFVRGDFFEAKMGFLVTTDKSGAVTSVTYVMKLP